MKICAILCIDVLLDTEMDHGLRYSGGRLNKKDRLTGYGDPHVKDKTSYRPSYL